MKLRTVSSLVVRLLCLALCQVALTLSAIAANTPTPLNGQDQAFVAKATADDALQITLAQVVLKQSTSPEVRALAQRIISDHQALDRRLTRFSVARKAHGQAHGTSSDEVTKARLQLGQLHGEALDKAFAGMMIKEHEKAIPLYEKAAKESHDPTLRAIARDGLDMLRQHLHAAQALGAS